MKTQIEKIVQDLEDCTRAHTSQKHVLERVPKATNKLLALFKSEKEALIQRLREKKVHDLPSSLDIFNQAIEVCIAEIEKD